MTGNNIGLMPERDDQFEEKVLESCPNCGRTFLPDRLAIHLRSCKENKPLTQKRVQGKVRSSQPNQMNR